MATSGKPAYILEVPSDDPRAAKTSHPASDQLASTATSVPAMLDQMLDTPDQLTLCRCEGLTSAMLPFSHSFRRIGGKFPRSFSCRRYAHNRQRIDGRFPHIPGRCACDARYQSA